MDMEKRAKKEQLIEIIVAVFLGVAALATAWASWIGALHGGVQATCYTTSNNMAADGNARYNEAAQSLMQDMLLWNQISDTRIDYTFAEMEEDTATMEKLDWKLEQLLNDNCSDALYEAILWADEQPEAASPFEQEGFVDSYFTDALTVLAESEALLEEGKQANEYDDSYGLVTVIYSVILFLLGIVGTFKNLPNRFIVLGVALVGFIFATVYMFTLPLPADFSLLSFFG